MQCIRGPLAALMSFSLLLPPQGAAGQTGTTPASDPQMPKAQRSARQPCQSAQLQGDQRILHALNRFTFGPRPGDLDTVRTTGLERWFDQQLHPGQIDEAALDARLAAYPAMRWSSEDLLRRLPSNAVIRRAMDGKIAVPESEVLHAVYEDAMYRLAEKKQEKQNNAQPASTGDASPSMDAQNDDAVKLMYSLDSGGGKNEQAGMMRTQAKAPGDAAESEVIASILALPAQQRIARLIAMQPIEADTFFKSLKGPQRAALSAGMEPELKETVGALENPERTVVEELIAQRLIRDIYSNAQLQEVMTDFWINHFNVFLRKNEATPYYLVSYERDVIRPHALGKFEDLLEAVAHSPAMLLYLDNASSAGPDSPAAERAKLNAFRNPNAKKNQEGLNENYARELMELHTLGVNGGYSQTDVIQVARILSGWTVDRPQRGGGFKFDPNRHEPGTKKVMGQKFKEGGEREGRELLHFLVTRPATARFLSRKLAVRFASDDPPASLVDRMAKAYLSSGGDISVMLKTLFHSPEFWQADVCRAKVKTPLEYVVSAVHASGADVSNLRPLAEALRNMGMPLYGAIPPTGYKWEASDWVSTGALVNRMNFALALAANRLSGITTTWASSSPAASPQSEEARLEMLLFNDAVSGTTRSAVLQEFDAQIVTDSGAQSQNRAERLQVSAAGSGRNHASTTPQEKQDQLLAGLLLGSPEFQRR
jgi:uncharacterized protein (DUF1800 family)